MKIYTVVVTLVLVLSAAVGICDGKSHDAVNRKDEYDDDDDDNDNDFDDEDYDEDYESKMQQALSYHASKSHKVLERVLGKVGVVTSSKTDPDGNVVMDSDSVNQLWQVEFTLSALQRELQILFDLRFGKSDNDDEVYDDDEEDDDELMRKDPDFKSILDAIEDETLRNKVYTAIKVEEYRKGNLKKGNLDKYTYWELHAYFSCDRAFARGRYVYDTEMWNTLRQLYHDFAKEDWKDRSYDKDNLVRTYQYNTKSPDSLIEPFLAGGGKGRGIKAVRDISKGELVFNATNNTVVFTRGHAWRKFLFAINEQDDTDMVCDVLVWSWVQPLEEGGPVTIFIDFDNGSLLNEGREEHGWEKPNIRCGKEGDTMCMMDYYATNDIKEGDEMLCDYRGFAVLDGWGDMGLRKESV